MARSRTLGDMHGSDESEEAAKTGGHMMLSHRPNLSVARSLVEEGPSKSRKAPATWTGNYIAA